MGKTIKRQKTEDHMSKRMFVKKKDRASVKNELNMLKRK